MAKWGLRARAVAVAALVSAFAGNGGAQEATPRDPNEERRDALYNEGRELAHAKRWAEAAAKFREVVAIRSAPKALVALASAEQELGHLREARRLYLEAIAAARRAGLSADEDSANDGLAILKPRVPHIVLRLPADPQGVRIAVDGEPVEHPEAIDVDPGVHVVTVEAPGRHRFESRAVLAEGATQEIQVTLEPEGEPGRRDGGVTPPPLGSIVLGATGLVAMGVGVGLWASGRSKESDVRAECTGGTSGCPAALRPLADEASTQIVAGDVLFGVGGAAVAAAVVWWVLAPGAAKVGSARFRQGTTVAVTPAARGTWIAVRRQF